MDLGRVEVVREEDGKIVAAQGAAPPAPPLLAKALEVMREIRERLEAVLLDGRNPTWRAMLLSLLSALELVRGLVPRDRRREAAKRAKQIAEEGLAGKAVAAAVRDVQAAVMTAVIAGSVAASAGAGNGGGGGG